MSTLPTGAKTIVIVPSLPDHLLVVTRGFTVFGNALDTPSIKDWQLDQLVFDTAKATLSPPYTVQESLPNAVIVDYQSRMIASLDSDDGIAQILKANIKIDPPPDLYIVFCVSARSHPYVDAPNTPAYMQDIGISQQLPPWGLPGLPPILHSFLEMTVVDGKTMKVLYDTPLIMPTGSNVSSGALMSYDDPYPETPLKHFNWHDKWADMTPDQQAEIRSGIENMLKESVANTLKKSIMTP